jgi:hypothetical protein
MQAEPMSGMDYLLKDRSWQMLLKNSLSGEKGAWAKKIDVHNRSVFDDLASGKVLAYLGKTWI